MTVAECERTIAAPVDVVWRLLTTAEGLSEWMAATAEVDLRPGGIITWHHDNGEVVEGEVCQVVPMRRFVFTYGWATGFLPVPPRSTLVTIELDATPTHTVVSVRHDGLDADMAARHAEGWRHFIVQLGVRAEAVAI